MFEKIFYWNLCISLLINSMHSFNSKLKWVYKIVCWYMSAYYMYTEWHIISRNVTIQLNKIIQYPCLYSVTRKRTPTWHHPVHSGAYIDLLKVLLGLYVVEPDVRLVLERHPQPTPRTDHVGYHRPSITHQAILKHTSQILESICINR